ncbi:MAG: hypothetical protein CM15mP62_10320 [Rhodospirillaceae bacterium]|nr:MAG: hypothetical protein CM15mP62_10320 [Rhodospirillaceae bacterium]
MDHFNGVTFLEFGGRAKLDNLEQVELTTQLKLMNKLVSKRR